MCVKYYAGLQGETSPRWVPHRHGGLKCSVPSVATEWRAERLWCAQKEASHCLQSVLSDTQKGDHLSLCGVFIFTQPRTALNLLCSRG